MKINWKRAVSSASAIAVVLCLASCGSDTSPDIGEEHEPITMLQFNDLITDDFLEALHAEYPEINVEIIRYTGLNGSGYSRYSMLYDDMTDIFVSTQAFHPEIYSERFVDLSTYDFVNNYSTFMLNQLDVDGGIYLLPSGYTLSGISYNKTILQENGWSVPQSYNELMEMIPEIEAAGYRPFANASNLDGYPFNYFFNLGNTVYFGTQEGFRWKEGFPKGEVSAAGNEGLLEVAEYYQEWIDNGFISSEHTGEKEYLENGDTVFYLSLGISNYHYETEDGRTYDFGIMPWLSRDGSNNMLTRNVSRYWGINKHLEEPGNEQKLQDAIHVMEFISTNEGQETFKNNKFISINPLSDSVIPEDSPYYELNDLIKSGHSVQLVFVGWENMVIPIAGDIRKMINGELKPEELPEKFDLTYNEVINQGTEDYYGTLTKRLTYEETVKLYATAIGKAADADCALVSVTENRSSNEANEYAVSWYLHEGDINMEKINIIKPKCGTLSVAEMTGAQIKEIQAAGFDVNENGKPYEYRLFTKNDAELDDDTTYRLVIGTEDMNQSVRESTTALELTPTDAIAEYIKELGTFSADDIVWKQ